MTYDELADEVKRRFPALAAKIDVEARDWDPDPIGGDIVLADIFVPFLLAALQVDPPDDVMIRAAAQFIEELAASADRELRTAARLSVLQALEDHPAELERACPSLGPLAKAMLPTRGVDGLS
ncbi:DUF7674 family protein [Patulibacter defluvii]|uniref:DUF7674 family protein n=1 Tax=Patulibacter defluvii TaxID=3095358 RepID=UPI002A765585|nr:hypothetical protein [Patulibacter sp. DM4]